MRRLFGTAIVCASLMATAAPALAQIPSPPANADAARDEVARAFENASRVVGIVERATAHPRLQQADSVEQLVAVLDEQADELASARAELAALLSDINASRNAISGETEAGQLARRRLDDIAGPVGRAADLLGQLHEVRMAVRSSDPLRNQRIQANIGAYMAASIVQLDWHEALFRLRASEFPMPGMDYAWNGGVGCFFGGVKQILRADAGLSTPSGAGSNVANAADCLRRMISMGEGAQADQFDPAKRRAALDTLAAAATLLERAGGDLLDTPSATNVLSRYGSELESVQTRIGHVENWGSTGQDQ